MGERHTRLGAALAAAWEAEVVAARRLSALSNEAQEPALRARLLVLSAFCRARASRLLSRLAGLGRGPLPVPDEPEEGPSLLPGLKEEATAAKARASRLQGVAELARQRADLSSAWVCELNRSEEEDLARELVALAENLLVDVARAPG